MPSSAGKTFASSLIPHTIIARHDIAEWALDELKIRESRA